MRRIIHWAIIITLVLISNCSKPAEISEEKAEAAEASDIVVLSAESQRTFGVKVEPAPLISWQEEITYLGRIDFDQQRLAHLTSRVAGRVEKAYVFPGDRVKAHDLLATIYSQEYLTAQAEFIQADQRLALAQARHDSIELTTAIAILESARRKLLVIGATEPDLQELARTRVPKTWLEVRAPFAGTVIEAEEIWGHFVDVGDNLFHLADLTSVWLLIDIYEKDLAKTKPGQAVQVEMAAYPGEKFHGRLTRVFDVVDENTRAVKGRVELPNPDRKLKPGMFATVRLQTNTEAKVLALPILALQMEGDSHFVFLAINDSSFQKRTVRIGAQFDGWQVITDGIQPGDEVVVAGAFDLKAELAKSTFEEE